MAKRSRKDESRMTIQSLLTLRRRIMRRLKKVGPNGMTRTELYRSLSHPITATIMDMALNTLLELGEVKVRRIETGKRGRPSEVWWATGRKVSHDHGHDGL